MSTTIKEFPDGTKLEFDKGKIDDWCVYRLQGGRRTAPKDIEYFGRLQQLSAVHGADNIYADFVKIYDVTDSQVNQSVLNEITQLAPKYGRDSLEIDKLFTIIYAGMIAEENKQHTKLGKKVKRLGLHQLLKEHFQPQEAASFSIGKPWRELDGECCQRGF
jgi:chorismate mutase